LQRGCRGPFGLRRAGTDGESNPVGHELKQVAVLPLEPTRRQRADVQYTQHIPADEQRDPEQRADTLLPQDRVEHIRVIDLFDEHRLLLGGDAPGEPAPERNAHSLPHLLLNASGRGRDEIAR
jgi:hypothetical protein